MPLELTFHDDLTAVDRSGLGESVAAVELERLLVLGHNRAPNGREPAVTNLLDDRLQCVPSVATALEPAVDHETHEHHSPFKASALLWTARRIPPPLVKAIVEHYLQEEARDHRGWQPAS
jgi:hypothetical protein